MDTASKLAAIMKPVSRAGSCLTSVSVHPIYANQACQLPSKHFCFPCLLLVATQYNHTGVQKVFHFYTEATIQECVLSPREAANQGSGLYDHKLSPERELLEPVIQPSLFFQVLVGKQTKLTNMSKTETKKV